MELFNDLLRIKYDLEDREFTSANSIKILRKHISDIIKLVQIFEAYSPEIDARQFIANFKLTRKRINYSAELKDRYEEGVRETLYDLNHFITHYGRYLTNDPTYN
jgi:hypothetical protein